jgi:ADP-ribose pyrophosphatase
LIEHGPWKILSSRDVYSDPWLRVRRDEVIRPDGRPGSYATVHIKAGVSVLAIDDSDHVYLTSEFHYAVGRVTLETVSGGIDANETAEQAAHRELEEELGIIANELIDLGTVDPFTASILSPTKLYLARKLSFAETRLEGTEQIERIKIPFAEAVQLVMDSTITHAPSCTLILKAARWLNRTTIG